MPNDRSLTIGQVTQSGRPAWHEDMMLAFCEGKILGVDLDGPPTSVEQLLIWRSVRDPEIALGQAPGHGWRHLVGCDCELCQMM